MASAPWFQVRMAPDRAWVMMASSQLSTTSARKWRDSSVAFRSVMSLPKTDTPMAFPSTTMGLKANSRVRPSARENSSLKEPSTSACS